MGKPFLPTNWPKSRIVFVLAVLSGLLVFGPLLFVGHFYEMAILSVIGEAGFVLSWLVGMGAGVFSFIRNASGQYQRIEHKSWKEQVW